MNMKKISKQIALLLLAIVAVSCSDNKNWTIVTDIQPGIYITGDATVYSNEAPASALRVLQLDGKSEGYPEIVGMYTWLKAGNFDISIVTEVNQSVKYGKGEEIVNEGAVKSYTLVQDGPSLSVGEGFYYIVVNTSLKEIHILPVPLGVIGAATPNGWNGETPLSEVTFDENSLVVTWSGNLNITAGEYKFRYGGDWGHYIDYDASTKARLFTDLGVAGEEMGPLTEGGFSDVKPGGKNITTEIGGEFKFTVKYEIRTRKFQATYKVIGDPVTPPDVDLPSAMYIIGSPFDWNWGNAKALTPVHGFAGSDASPGAEKSIYWMMQYFNSGDAIKFNFNKDWDGNDFGFPAISDEAIAFADITNDGGNIKVGKAGWYIVTVTTTYNDDETGLLHTVDFHAPNIYLIGNTLGKWETVPEGLFTVPATADGEFISPAFVAADELRMNIKLEGIDWWKTEFIIIDGKIEYRGNGGDQERVTVAVGQKAYLKFSDGTGKIK